MSRYRKKWAEAVVARLSNRYPLSAMHRARQSCAQCGLTFVEVLVALLISLAFLTSATAAFVQIMRATDIADRKMNGINNVRAAMDVMRLDLQAARYVASDPMNSFVGLNNSLAYGDMIDNDGDGLVDEELADGLDNDGDYVAGTDDQHALIGINIRERTSQVGVADWGDQHVDEDVVFDNDQLRFRVFPRDPLNAEMSIAYSIGTFGTSQNVLLRTIISGTGSRVEPLAFDVLSLNFQYWDPNRLALRPTWVNSWNSAGPFAAPGLQLPVAVRIEIKSYTGTKLLENVNFPPTEKIETASMSTVVNIEQTLNDPRYDIVRGTLNNLSF